MNLINVNKYRSTSSCMNRGHARTDRRDIWTVFIAGSKINREWWSCKNNIHETNTSENLFEKFSQEFR